MNNQTSGTHMLHRAFQFVLRALAARGWSCATPQFATSVENFAEFGVSTGNFALNDHSGTFDALALRGAVRLHAPPSGSAQSAAAGARRFFVVFRHANANKPQAQAMVDGAMSDDVVPETSLGAACLIVVQPQPLTQQAKAVLCGAFLRVDAFTYDACTFDAMHSPQVPLHRRLRRAERERLFARMAKEDLPRILHSDPVCVWFGWKRGAVVEVQQLRHCGLVRNFRVVV